MLWLNLGDSYNSRPAGNHPGRPETSGLTNPERQAAVRAPRPPVLGFKPKDLLMVPARVALALQDAGWYLRKDVIWDKPDPMPESTRDRPTSAHEHVFMLAKSERYFYDLDGYREPSTSTTGSGNGYRRAESIGHDGQGERNSDDRWQPQPTRQLRDVWRIPLQPFPGAHFAVFPPELPRRCILLGSSPRACDRCRAPFRRIVHVSGPPSQWLVGGFASSGQAQPADRAPQSIARAGHHGNEAVRERRTLGWRPSCACGAPHGILPDDLEVIDSPTGTLAAPDPSEHVGRRGFARERTADSGTRPMTRYEQRQYARQLAGSPNREALEREATEQTFAHYLRTDRAGARPPRPELLEQWLERGWLERVEPPAQWWSDHDGERCIVLDPFAGAGTTGLVAVDEGRDFVGVELNADYAAMARARIGERWASPRFDFV